MSEKEKSNALSSVGNTISTLKEKSPLLLYGIIGAIVLAVFWLLTSGVSETQIKMEIVSGETYRLTNPNGGPVLLVAAPGLLSSAEDETKDGANICSVAPNTPVRAEESQAAFGIAGLYVRITPLEGDCNDKSGWTTISNIQK
ncbi:MAG: hypothetical protein V3V31_11725 [Methylococcales bacterium]